MKVRNLKDRISIPKNFISMKWGVAGCGKFLETTFIPTLRQNKRYKLVSVYSSNLVRAKEIAAKFSAENFFNDYKEFLKQDFDSLYISSKNSNHHWMVIEAAKAGKNILCEKPLALNSAQAEEMINVCKAKNVQLAINYVYRFHPLVQKAKELIDKQFLGKVIYISTNYNVDYPPNDNFRFVKTEGGGVLQDIGTHMIDLLYFLGGEIDEIKGYTGNVFYNSEISDTALAILKFKNGSFGQLNVSFNTRKAPNRIEIVGHNGTISIENLISNRNGTAKIVIDIYGEAKKAFRKRANKLSFLLKSVQKSFAKNELPEANAYDALMNIKLIENLEKQ